MKKPTHYLVITDYGNKPKNKLEKEFLEFLLQLDGTLIEFWKFTTLTSSIRAEAERLNERHKRCKPLKFKFYQILDGDFVINSDMQFVDFIIKAAYLKK